MRETPAFHFLAFESSHAITGEKILSEGRFPLTSCF